MSRTLADAKTEVGARARQSTTTRRDIQGLRAFAVLVVIANHLFHTPVGGFVGVDVFFVISGFLITSHMLRELEHKGGLSFGGFYRRRARRILPAATATIVVTVIAAIVLLPRGRALEAAVDGFWAFFFGANWRALATETDYFQLGLPPSPFQHFWSLSIEEQFYFVWPLVTVGLFALAVRLRRRWIVGGGFLVVSLASLGWAFVQTGTNVDAAYFSTFTRAWELGFGAVLAAALLKAPKMSGSLRIVLAWLGITGLVASLFLVSPGNGFPAPLALLPVLSTALVIFAGTGTSDPAYDRAVWPLSNRAVGYVGDISYSLYLWHFPVIVLLPALVPSGTLRFAAVCLFLTAALSVLSYHFIEQPVRKSGWLLKRPPGLTESPRRHVPVLAALALGMAVAVGAVGLRIAAPQPSIAAPAESVECFGASAAPGLEDRCEPPSVRADELVPSLDTLSEDTAGGYMCWRGQGQPFKTCTIGSEEPDARKVALIGDSHAAALLPALRDRLVDLNWSLDLYTGYGCQWRSGNEASDCADMMAQVQERVSDGSAPYDAIITTAARWAAVDAADSYAKAWDPALALGTRVVAVGDAPTVEAEALECISRLGVDVETCGTSSAEAAVPADPLRDAATVSGASFIETTDLYCDGSFCPAVIGGAIVYRDTAGHVTGTYMKSASAEYTARIVSALGE